MSAENENKEIIEEVCKALGNIYEAKQMLNSLERTLNYLEALMMLLSLQMNREV